MKAILHLNGNIRGYDYNEYSITFSNKEDMISYSRGNYDIPTSAEIVKEFDVTAFLEQENQLFDEDETYGNF